MSKQARRTAAAKTVSKETIKRIVYNSLVIKERGMSYACGRLLALNGLPIETVRQHIKRFAECGILANEQAALDGLSYQEDLQLTVAALNNEKAEVIA